MQYNLIRQKVLQLGINLVSDEPTEGFVQWVFKNFNHLKESTFDKITKQIEHIHEKKTFPGSATWLKVKSEVLLELDRTKTVQFDTIPDDELATDEDWDKFKKILKSIEHKFSVNQTKYNHPNPYMQKVLIENEQYFDEKKRMKLQVQRMKGKRLDKCA